ncbi:MULTISPECIES: hypothetical protein [Listeria]|uniref:Uncharacterized protein n=11 Tax=Listeria TaxID=1637 RepID=A0A7X0XU67_9LIST|nr:MULTISPECIES: hypothetical protein [Listeria]EEP3928414.1 hypothetical protein [Listeria monocytogenes serotype 4ab]EFR89461.1 conserved hypothetical protein [Listeria innocua FSL S4-378]EFR95638.1 conserved hypothetical protein [Listeria ivanovii FSL F6-596]EFS01898.1 conserved hypothetical protein [Listeria seeligeri FSL S4-171]AIS61060.1 hypothetical protein JL58_14255 [Listeria ivanovii subsp. londoniensis]
MIILNCPMKRDYITELLETYDKDGVTFKKIAEQGMKLTFETNIEDEEKAAKIAKETIKATEIGSVLYFQVSVG